MPNTTTTTTQPLRNSNHSIPNPKENTKYNNSRHPLNQKLMFGSTNGYTNEINRIIR